jgi:hypothetical protein
MTGMPSGRPGDSATTQRRIPTSRAYWNLRAEQILNRVFEREAPIDVSPSTTPAPVSLSAPAVALNPPTEPARTAEPAHTAEPLPTPAAPRQTSAGRPIRRRVGTVPAMPAPRRRDSPLALPALLGGVGALSLLGGLLYLNHWNQMQRSLSQERNLLLMERLRELGPAASAPSPTATAPAAPAAPSLPPVSAPATATAAAPTAGIGEDAPPPPPEEAWMSDLATLPSSSGPAPLRVPVSARLTAPAPPARPAPRASAPAAQAAAAPIAAPPSSVPLPQLVGVVAAPGRAGTAIFQVDGTSTSVAVGQGIGSSGWRLRATAGDSALIERGGELRRLSIGSGF